LTLIAGQPGGLDSAVAAEVRAALQRLGASADAVRWLDEGQAGDIDFDDLNPDQADAAARQVIGATPIDVIAQPRLDRRKRLLVADMESTLIRNEMLDELADFVGLREQIASVTARAMNGELDFAEALRARVALLKGLPIRTLDEAATRIEIMPGAATLVATMRHHGAYAVLVSGGFKYFTTQIRERLGLDEDHANVLLAEGGHLTGTVGEPILGREAKYDALIRLAASRRLPLTATLSVGDGANDIDMILAAGLGIAFHAKPAVAARAKYRIDHVDLTGLLYAQGYASHEFVI
jgi:phosphoserine phosphatase